MTNRAADRFHNLLIDQLVELYTRVRRDIHESTLRRLFDQEEARDEADEALRMRLRSEIGEHDSRLAQALEEAVRRIDDGTYGTCVDCGQPIEEERLEVVPWAIRCVDDQEAFERATMARPPTL